MFRIKRTKIGPGMAPLTTATSVHYARHVDGQGRVDDWVKNKAEATEFGAEVVKLVKDHYAGRENTGTIAFESTDPPPPVVEKPVVPEKPPEPPKAVVVHEKPTEPKKGRQDNPPHHPRGV